MRDITYPGMVSKVQETAALSTMQYKAALLFWKYGFVVPTGIEPVSKV
jgi:hypothetical protein